MVARVGQANISTTDKVLPTETCRKQKKECGTDTDNSGVQNAITIRSVLANTGSCVRIIYIPGTRYTVPGTPGDEPGTILFLFFLSSGGWVKIKLKLPHFHVSTWYQVRNSSRVREVYHTYDVLTVLPLTYCSRRVPVLMYFEAPGVHLLGICYLYTSEVLYKYYSLFYIRGNTSTWRSPRSPQAPQNIFQLFPQVETWELGEGRPD